MQKSKLVLLTALFFCLFLNSRAQKTYNYTNPEFKYKSAVELFNAEKYGSAIKLFEELKQNLSDKNSYLYTDASYYSALASSFLFNRDAEYKLKEFVKQYPENSKTNTAFFYLGNSLYSQKKYDEALQYYTKIKGVDLPNALTDEYNFKLGYCYFLDSNYTKAKDIFIQVKEGSSVYASPATYYYAHILYVQKEYTVALVDFEKLKTDKNFGDIVPFYITHIYYLQAKYDELLKYAPDVVQKASPKREAEISRMIGEAYYHKADYQKALEYLQPAIEKNAMPSNQDLYCMGYSYYQLKEYSKAKIYFVKLSSTKDSLSQNAMYYLAHCYLNENDKQAARTAFYEVYTLNFDETLREEALFNYAKLSMEIPNNPFNEAIKAFKEYQTNYPKSSRKNEINEIMANLYFSIKNYKDALELIETITPKTKAINEAYQRIALNRGIEVFNEGKTTESIPLFDIAIKNDYNQKLTSSAHYLRGEANYRLNDFFEAESELKNFFDLEGGTESLYYKNACYTMGYSYLKLKKYEKSADYFNRYLTAIKGEKSKTTADVYNRMGDCNFVTKKFAQAIEFYNKNIAIDLFDVDYAIYQKALSQGALGEFDTKTNTLNTFINEYPNSIYAPAAHYELANTYLVLENNNKALQYYNLLIKKYPNSNNTREASLKVGMVQYTQGNDDEALKSLDNVVKSYPNTSEAYDALVSIKNIYIAQNRVDEYFNYVKNIPQIQVSSNEKDSLTYSVAENRYFENDCNAAIKGFGDYISKYPDGLYLLNANYFRADCFYKQGKYELALPNYEYVIGQPKSKYTETALLNASSICFNLSDYKRANEYYTLLEENTEIKTNKTLAKRGIMRTYFRLNNYQASIKAAEQFLQSEKITDEAADEANYIMASSYFATKDTINARLKFKTLVKSKNGEIAGEANYRLAEMLYHEKRIIETDKAITGIAANPTSEYWLAKSFILWAKVYEEKGNLFQAKATLKSIIDGYDGEELVREAQNELNRIQAAEQKLKEEQEKKADVQKEDVEVIKIEETSNQ